MCQHILTAFRGETEADADVDDERNVEEPVRENAVDDHFSRNSSEPDSSEPDSSEPRTHFC